MPKKLKDLIVTRVDVVDKGANEGAMIAFYKRDDGSLAPAGSDPDDYVTAISNSDLPDEVKQIALRKHAETEEEIALWEARQRDAVNVVRKRRDEQGMTQVQLAALTGIPQSRLSDYENGLRISTQHCEAIAKAFRTTPAEMFPEYGPWTMDDAHRRERARTDPAVRLRGDA